MRVCVASNMLWLCTQGYPLLSLKVIPQMPESSIKFSSHTWSGLLKHLHQVLSARFNATDAQPSSLFLVQMQIANAKMEEGINWHVSLPADDRRSNVPHEVPHFNGV